MENKLKIKSISINNFKSIWNSEEIDISGGIIPILGMNGAGKSNILKAIDWFSNGKYSESIKNFYRDGNNLNQTYVSFNIGINLTQKENSAFNDSNKLIIKTFLESMIIETIDKISLISPLNTVEVNKEYNNFITESLSKDVVRVFKIRKEIENKGYSDLYTINKFPTFGIERNSSDYLKLIQIISEYISKFLINSHFPQIKFYKTSETLNDFSNNKKLDPNSEFVDNEISFDTLFTGIPLKYDTMPNFKLIDNMIKSMNHEEIDSLDTFSILASKEYTSSGNMHDDKGKFKITLSKFQELFSQWINENAFFKSINTNMTFMIYPEIMNGTEVKLTMFDVVKIDGEEPRKHLLDDIRKKNDGFIFALLLFFDIEFSHNNETIILIDEPANFLSTNSIRLLMETFRRSKKQRDIKFIFTTHSSNTLDKNIVEIGDVLIARKGKDHSTIIDKAVKIKPNSPEWEIIYDEYKIPRKGIDIIKESKNYLVSAEKAFEKDFYRIIDSLNIGNIIPLVDIKILRNNLKIISKINDEFTPGKLDEKFSGKLNIVELFNEYEISELVYDLEIMGGDASPIRMKKEEEYKVLWLTRILRHFENDVKGLIEGMPKSMDRIKEVFINE